MKRNLLLLFSLTSFIAISQNTWNGTTVPTTTNGIVTIGNPGVLNANLNIFNSTKNYGLNVLTTTNSSQTEYGIYNSLTSTNNSGVKYGIFNQMLGNSTATKYGIYNSLQSSGASTFSYGIYSTVTGNSARAAYFNGDVELNKSNTIYSAANGSKFMLFSNHTSTNPNNYAISFVPNSTNNQEDWHWGRTLELYRDGSMTKNVTSADKAFTIRRSDWAIDVFRIYGDGKLYATEINVRLADDFPDYVFEKDYNLLPISDLKNYISENGRLPKMPTAKNIENDGLNIGETTRLLVEKIEELTLYIIQQEEQIKLLKNSIRYE